MLRRFLSRFRRDESGATALEYALILSLMFLVFLGAVTAAGNAASDMFIRAVNLIRAAMGG